MGRTVRLRYGAPLHFALAGRNVGVGTALLTWCEHEARQRLRRHFFAQSPHLRSDPAVMAQLA